MAQIQKMIVHVLDCEHNVLVFSDLKIEEFDETAEKMITSKINKIFQSNTLKDAYFHETSEYVKKIREYKEENISFEELSKQLTQNYFDTKMRLGQYLSSDMWCVEVLHEDRRYFMMVENTYQDGLTHHIAYEEQGVKNEIIPYKTLLSSSMRKNDQAILVELFDESVKVIEQKIESEGKKRNFISEFIIDAGSKPSYKESITVVEKVSKQMSEKYDISEIDVLPKMKKMIVESADNQTEIKVDEMAEVLFNEYPLAKSDFKDEMRKSGIEKEINVPNKKPTKSNKLQKITTDTGIEISFPVDYIDSKDMIEFKNNPDGTILIQLKNINKINSK